MAVGAVYSDLQAHSLLQTVLLPCSFIVGTFFLFRFGHAVLFLVGFWGMCFWAADDRTLLENVLIPMLLLILGAGLFLRWLLSDEGSITVIEFQSVEVDSGGNQQSQAKSKGQYRHQYDYRHEKAHEGESSNVISPLDEAYLLLGARPEMSDAEVKKAYQRLISVNHPDKLIARGVSAHELAQATRKTQMIRAAYERIVEARKCQQAKNA